MVKYFIKKRPTGKDAKIKILNIEIKVKYFKKNNKK